MSAEFEVIDDDEVVQILDNVGDEITSSKVFIEGFGANFTDAYLVLLRSGSSHLVGLDVVLDSNQDSNEPNWAWAARFLADVLVDNGFFFKLEEELGIDAQTEQVVCMRSGSMIRDWGYFD